MLETIFSAFNIEGLVADVQAAIIALISIMIVITGYYIIKKILLHRTNQDEGYISSRDDDEKESTK